MCIIADVNLLICQRNTMHVFDLFCKKTCMNLTLDIVDIHGDQRFSEYQTSLPISFNSHDIAYLKVFFHLSMKKKVKYLNSSLHLGGPHEL